MIQLIHGELDRYCSWGVHGVDDCTHVPYDVAVDPAREEESRAEEKMLEMIEIARGIPSRPFVPDRKCIRRK